MLHFGVVPEPQPPETINGLRLLLHNATGNLLAVKAWKVSSLISLDWELGCLDTLVSRTKSLVLGLALWKGVPLFIKCVALTGDNADPRPTHLIALGWWCALLPCHSSHSQGPSQWASASRPAESKRNTIFPNGANAREPTTWKSWTSRSI